MYRLILVASLVAVALAAGKGGNKCPWVMAKYPFDESKFLGDWYYISGTDSMLTGNRCSKMTLTSKPEYGVGGTFTALDKESHAVTYEAIMQSLSTDKPGYYYSVAKKSGTDTWSTIYKSSIVATDYDHYALIIACKPSFDPKTKTFGRVLSAKILGRSRTLSKDITSTLTNLVSGYDIDVTQFETIPQTNCA